MIDQPSAMHTKRLGRGRPARRGSRAGDQRPRSTQASQRPPTLGRRPDHGIRGAEGTLFDAMTNWSLVSHGSNPSRQPLGSFSCTRKATPAQFVIVRCCSVDHVLPNGKRAGLRDRRQPPFPGACSPTLATECRIQWRPSETKDPGIDHSNRAMAAPQTNTNAHLVSLGSPLPCPIGRFHLHPCEF